jgi:hypothetical protein
MNFEKEFPMLSQEGGFICHDGHERFNKGNIEQHCIEKDRARKTIESVRLDLGSEETDDIFEELCRRLGL